MKVYLSDSWRQKLANLSGAVDIQHVDIFLKNGEIIHNISVFNGDHFDIQQKFDIADIDDICLHHGR